MKDIINKIDGKAKSFFKGVRGSHGWDHVTRVLALCERIGPPENCDMTVLRLSALLHDIGRDECDRINGKKCHAEVGTKLAGKVLVEEGVSSEVVEQVLHCIASHRFRNDVAPQSHEARVLYDADKLDSIGAVGVGRAFQFAGEIGAMFHDPDVNPETTESYGPGDTAYCEYLVKLRHIHGKMLTVTGSKMATARHGFMEEFFERLNREAEGLL